LQEGRGNRARRLGGRAPDDIEVLEFALKWRINPQEVRERWDLRDMRWLEVVERAQALAQPEIEKRATQKAQRKAKKRR